MTHYYLYIKAGVRLDSDTRFYMVGIGEGEEGRRVYTWLESYAFEHGHFFIRDCPAASDFLLKCMDSVGLPRPSVFPVKGAQLVRFLKTGDEDPAFLQACRHRHALMMKIDPHYYTYYHLSR